MDQQHKDIVAIGGSAGSGEVLQTILKNLPSNLPASIFITTMSLPIRPAFSPRPSAAGAHCRSLPPSTDSRSNPAMSMWHRPTDIFW